MGQYDNLKILKQRRARTNHQCFSCGRIINSGEFYYSEELSDKYINYPHKKKFCIICHKKYANAKRKNN